MKLEKEFVNNCFPLSLPFIRIEDVLKSPFWLDDIIQQNETKDSLFVI